MDDQYVPVINSTQSISPSESTATEIQSLLSERWRVRESATDMSYSQLDNSPVYLHYFGDSSKTTQLLEENALTGEITEIPLINAGK